MASTPRSDDASPRPAQPSGGNIGFCTKAFFLRAFFLVHKSLGLRSPPSVTPSDASGGGGGGEGFIRREAASDAAPGAVRQAVGGGCQSGRGRLLLVTNAIEAGTCRQGGSGWA